MHREDKAVWHSCENAPASVGGTEGMKLNRPKLARPKSNDSALPSFSLFIVSRTTTDSAGSPDGALWRRQC